MSFLIDTNVLSEIKKADRADTEVQRWFASIKVEEVHISVLVLGEIRRGVERIRRRGDLIQASALERWLERLESSYAERILDIDAKVANLWGSLQVPNPASEVDSLLAATAIVHDLVLVTRNVKDVQGTGVRCLNPFEPPVTTV